MTGSRGSCTHGAALLTTILDDPARSTARGAVS
jgi:hypothetical protein